MIKRATVLAACATLALSGCVASSPDGRLEAYMQAVAGAESDRGWHYLGESAREFRYHNDRALYLRDAAAADWDAFLWADASVSWTDGGFSHVQVELLSAPSTVPSFLIANGLLHGVCVDDEFRPIALGAIVEGRLFGEGSLGGGGWTGSQIECNSRFIGDAAYEEVQP